jgi:hypothetical protein
VTAESAHFVFNEYAFAVSFKVFPFPAFFRVLSTVLHAFSEAANAVKLLQELAFAILQDFFGI